MTATAAPIALVTGASRGIGFAIAEALAAFARTVVIVARSQASLCYAAERLRRTGAEICELPADLADPAATDRLRDEVAGRFDRLDVLVHAAGVYDADPTARAGELMAVNYIAPARLTTGLLPLLRAAHGEVVFINSTQGLNANGDAGAYAASKAALRAFADSFRARVNADGIRVLTVFAGSTATAMQESIALQRGREFRTERLMQPADIAAMVVAATQLPRTAEVTELTMRPMLPPA